MKKLLSLALIATLFSATGCSSWFSSTPDRASHADTAQGALVQKKAFGVEVTWEVPSEPADGFIIRYGENRTQLSKEVRVSVAELQEERDMEYGPVYRYLIRDAAPESSMFVSIAAVKGDTVSDFSEVVEESQRPAITQ